MAGRLILVTGATGKVGQTFMHRLLGDAALGQDRIRALCHNRTLPETIAGRGGEGQHRRPRAGGARDGRA